MNQTFLLHLVSRFEQLEARLNQLDAATGDGDHGGTILKGMRAAAATPDAPVVAFRKAAGGASGSLFSLLIGALEQAENDSSTLGDALATAARKISQLGQARAGDKTMLDALLPAAAAANADPANPAAAAAEAARRGAEATKPMQAKRGRAKYVEGGGVGHLDAGAFSVAEILTQFSKEHGEQP
ncbi:DAK2 domain-containing protein [Devosia rhodophyticola]|uniref:DAK2 domain-containing protein n=1 Tax=Devosia rhodophyticola TaxID=3026423 RepID=A0ABY7YYG7_9HYPH|nr:DAK2 domain-containing protein [Devosia rhodophyticola]WDR06277.1 DAK2 domain-containing protein [Devosia rhodophyticola]